VGALSLLNRNNKKYRILLNNTKDVIKNDINKANDLVGRTLVIAESDVLEDIMSAWTNLDSLLFPMLVTINQSRVDKRMTWSEFVDMLQGIEDKRKKKRKSYQIGAQVVTGPPPPTIAEPINKPTIDKIVKAPIVEETEESPPSTPITPVTPQPATVAPIKKIQSKKPIVIADIDQATDVVREYAQNVSTLRDAVKKLGTARQTPKILGTVETLLERTREASVELERFMSRSGMDQRKSQQPQSEQQQILSKLNIQYRELKQILQSQVLSNVHVQEIETKLNEEKQKKAQEERRQKLLQSTVEEEDEVKPISVNSQQQQQLLLTKPKRMQVGRSTQFTVNVEQELAKETLRDLQGLEEDMNELYEINKDLNTMIKDQDPIMQKVASNAEDANRDIQRGSQNLKDARSYRTLGF
jgi:DNA-directed RNA polymerase subunit H (RpoH/RPB5)